MIFMINNSAEFKIFLFEQMMHYVGHVSVIANLSGSECLRILEKVLRGHDDSNIKALDHMTGVYKF